MLPGHMERGIFVTFEGPEAAGKTTQIRRLAARLEARGQPVLLVREPGGTALGESIRRLLKQDSEEVSARAEFLLFAASRAQLIQEKIMPALKAGTWVLCDRFVDSSWVYQGIARGLPLELIEAVNGFATFGIMPDITFLMELSWEVSSQRLANRRYTDRLEQEPEGFHQAVVSGYKQLAKKYPERVVVLDAQEHPEYIEEAITHVIEKRFPKACLAK